MAYTDVNLLEDHLSYNAYGTSNHMERQIELTNRGFIHQEFKCPFTGYIIEFYTKEHTAWFNYKKISYDNFKALFLLLRRGVESVKVKKFRHVVLINDIDLVGWTVVHKGKEVMTVECDYDELLPNIDHMFA